MYEDEGLSRKIGLLRNLISTRLENCDNMQSYIDSIMSYSNNLTGVGFEMTDEWISAILLAGSTDEFRPFIMGIEASNGVITSDNLISKLIYAQSGENANGEAFFGKKKFNKKKNFQRKCYNCKSKFYLNNTCDKLRKNNNENSKKDNNEKTRNAFCAMLCETNKNEWYVDSGASSHMTPHGNLLEKIKSSTVKQIISANNAKMNVRNVGSLTLNLNKNNIEVKDVFVPELVANLLSVNKIVENGNSVLFNKNGCTTVILYFDV